MKVSYRARFVLVRFAKILPFFLCSIILISYIESLSSLATNSYCIIDGCVTLYKPISWCVGNVFIYEWYTIVITIILSFAMETCWYNKASIIYLCVNLWERDYFLNVELYEETIYLIVIANIIISGFFVWKGITIITNKP